MTNAFHWSGAPSIFTTGQRQGEFGAGREGSRQGAINKRKAAPVVLPGSSKFLPPALVLSNKDVLVSGGELGRKVN